MVWDNTVIWKVDEVNIIRAKFYQNNFNALYIFFPNFVFIFLKFLLLAQRFTYILHTYFNVCIRKYNA